MYGYEYEFDFLLCLRLLKFLHMQSPEAAKRVVEIYKELDTEEIGIVMEEILWDIFSDAEFDTDEFNELTIVYFSHRDIDRLYELGRQESARHGRFRFLAQKDPGHFRVFCNWADLFHIRVFAPFLNKRCGV